MGRYDSDSEFPWKFVSTLVSLVLLLLIAGGMYGCPKYQAWTRNIERESEVREQTLRGEAELRRAEQNRRIAVLEAEAALDAAKLKAAAEVERAKGVAEANRIVADGLKGNEEYLRYLWIDKISQSGGREVIYVPTETGLPILESGRHVAHALEK